MTQPYDYVEMKIPAKPEYVGIIRLTLSGIGSRMGFSYEEIEDLKIATSEACTNAVHHAYEREVEGGITVGFGLYPDKLEVMVADRGKSFNYDEIKKEIGPYDKENEQLPEGGLGLYLIETLMDELKIFIDSGVTVYMTKYLQKERVGSDDKTISTSITN